MAMVCGICNKNFKTKDTDIPICGKCRKKRYTEKILKRLERDNNDHWEMLILLLKESPKSKENTFLEKINCINKIKSFIYTKRDKHALCKKRS